MYILEESAPHGAPDRPVDLLATVEPIKEKVSHANDQMVSGKTGAAANCPT